MKQHFVKAVLADKKRMITCCITTALLCWITHGYSYANATFFHDRSDAFSDFKFDSAIRAKWMAQYWDYTTYFSYLPWLFGVLVTIFFIISVYLIVNILEIHNTFSILLIAGILITRNEVTGAHLYWPHEILAALPLCLVSVWIWKQEKIPIGYRMFGGMIFVGLSLASYGAYTSVAPFIVIIALIIAMINGIHWKRIFARGFEYVITFLLGMVLYYIVLRLFLYVQGLSLLDYGNESRLIGGFPPLSELLNLIFTAYKEPSDWFTKLPVMRWMIFSAGILLVGLLLRAENFFKPMNVVLLAVLIGLIPLCAGSIWVMSFDTVHWLMTYACEILYVFFIVLLDKSNVSVPSDQKEQHVKYSSLLVCSGASLLVMFLLARNIETIGYRYIVVLIGIIVYSAVAVGTSHLLINLQGLSGQGKSTRAVSAEKELWFKRLPSLVLTALLCFTLYQGILTANLVYNEADRVDRTTKSFASRMMTHVESYEGFTGTETLVFAGDFTTNPALRWIVPVQPETKALFNNTSLYPSFGHIYWGLGVTYRSRLRLLLATDTGCNYTMEYYAPDQYTTQQQEQISRMPLYPISGSIQKIDETIVIKIGEIK